MREIEAVHCKQHGLCELFCFLSNIRRRIQEADPLHQCKIWSLGFIQRLSRGFSALALLKLASLVDIS